MRGAFLNIALEDQNLFYEDRIHDGMDESEIQVICVLVRSCKLLFWNNYFVKREKLTKLSLTRSVILHLALMSSSSVQPL